MYIHTADPGSRCIPYLFVELKISNYQNATCMLYPVSVAEKMCNGATNVDRNKMVAKINRMASGIKYMYCKVNTCCNVCLVSITLIRTHTRSSLHQITKALLILLKRASERARE